MLVIRGGPYRVDAKSVSVGSSGTTLYFMIGLASLADAPVTLTAQKYFRRRPVGPLLDALSNRWASSSNRREGVPHHRRAASARAADGIVIPGTLSQWISGDFCSRRSRAAAPRSKSKASSTNVPTSS